VKIDLVTGVTPVSLRSIEQTAEELTQLIQKCRGDAPHQDLGTSVAAREVAELAHSTTAGLVAVAEHPAADPAILFGVLVAVPAPIGPDGAAELRAHLGSGGDGGGSDIVEVTEARTPRGYPILFAERVVTPEQLRAGEPFDCQLQAVVADPHQPRIAVFTLSSSTGRGWLELAALFAHLVASTDFAPS
jgi:hypothetical protein